MERKKTVATKDYKTDNTCIRKTVIVNKHKTKDWHRKLLTPHSIFCSGKNYAWFLPQSTIDALM